MNHFFSVLAASMALFLCTATLLQADTMVTLTPSEFIQVSLDGDTNGAGTVNAGTVGGNTYFIRERANTSEEDLRIASFLRFDFSSLTPAEVNHPDFTADFTAEIGIRTNTVNSLAVGLGRVQDDGVNGNTWNTSAAPGTFPLFEWGLLSADQQTLVPDVDGPTAGTAFTVDITSIVQDIVNGVNGDNGFVLFGETTQNQGSGFENAVVALNVPQVPEPASIAIWSLIGLGLVGFGFYRRRRTIL